MANEQTLTIKLNVDTTQAGKLELVTKSFSENSIKLAELEKARNEIINQQNKAYFDLKNMVDKANIAISDGAKGANLGIINTTNAANRLTASYAAMSPILKELNSQIDKISKSSGIIPGKPGVSFAGVAGLSQNPTPINEKVYYDAVKALEESHTRHLQEQLKQEEFSTKASYNARQAMYNELFRNQRTSLTAGMTQAGTFAASPSQQLTAGMGAAGLQAIKDTETAHKKLSQAVDETEKAHRGLILRIVEGVLIYKIYNASINLVLNSLKAIPKIGIELDSTNASLLATVGSAAGAGSVLAILDREAERTGITIGTLRESFRGFQASTSLAGETLDTTWRMFTNLDTVITGLHLSTDKANGIFLAMAQIFNKGKVQSEELVKQLGNLLPGAFASFAAATGRSTQQLSQDMKKGLVSAHEEIAKFTEYMAQRFQVSFEAASQGLNANIGRMTTGFTHLGEAIYASTSGPMLATVKAITSITNYLTDAVDGTNNFGKVLSGVLDVALSATIVLLGKMALESAFVTRELALLAGGATISSRAMVGLRGAMSFISAPTAILAGIGSIALYLKGLADDADAVHERIQKTFEAQSKKAAAVTTEEKIKLSIDEDPSVKSARADLAFTNKAIDFYKKSHAEGTAVIASENEKIAKLRMDALNGAINVAALEKNARLALETEMSTASVTAMEESFKMKKDVNEEFLRYKNDADSKAQLALESFDERTEKARAYNLLLIQKGAADTASEEQKKIAAESQGEIAKLDAARRDVELHAREEFSKKASKAELTGLKEGYKENQQEAKLNTTLIGFELDALKRKYTDNGIAVAEYFRQKQVLELQDVNFSIAQNQKSLQEAFAGKDKAKIAELNVKQEELLAKQANIVAKNTDESVVANDDLNKSLQETHALYLSITEQKGAGAKEAFDAANADKKALYLKNNQVERARELDLIGQAKGLEGDLTDINDKRVKANTVYNESIAKTNILFNTGAIGRLQSYKLLDVARDKEIEQMKETVALNEKVLSQPGLDEGIKTSAMKRVEAAKNALDNLQAEGSAFANAFNTTVGGALENSFAGMITGTMNAKQAMQSFTTSVLQDIAKIIANEARSAIIGQIFSIGKSMFGGSAATVSSIGSATSYGSSGNSASFSSLISGAFANPKALGGVSSAPGLSAISGSVLHGPTIIPFATGGALAGEAGPEAIMPLARDSSGKLGVKVNGGNSGQSGGNVYNISVSVQAVKDETPSQTGGRVAEAMMTAIAQKEIANANRLNGTNNRITSFG